MRKSKNQTLWASKKNIASIFGIDRSVVSKHIKNIFYDKELDKNMVCANFAHTTQHGSIKGKQQTKEIMSRIYPINKLVGVLEMLIDYFPCPNFSKISANSRISRFS